MQELVNMANTKQMTASLRQYGGLAKFLADYHLEGIELMLCGPVDFTDYPPQFIKGVHLWFWPDWLDFWQHDWRNLLARYTVEQIKNNYGGLQKEQWLAKWRENFVLLADLEPQYLVFHVADVRLTQIRNRAYTATAADVLAATLELIARLPLQEFVADSCYLLCENLWWPGLDFLDVALAQRFLAKLDRQKKGFLLDIGHFLNTNMKIRSEAAALDYLQRELPRLAPLVEQILAIHLHYSASGAYTTAARRQAIEAGNAMEYVSHTDEHRPFADCQLAACLASLQPRFLVHEFLAADCTALGKSLKIQKNSLGEA